MRLAQYGIRFEGRLRNARKAISFDSLNELCTAMIKSLGRQRQHFDITIWVFGIPVYCRIRKKPSAGWILKLPSVAPFTISQGNWALMLQSLPPLRESNGDYFGILNLPTNLNETE